MFSSYNYKNNHMAPPTFNPRTMRIMKRALEVVLPPNDSDPESTDDEIDSYNFLESRKNSGYLEKQNEEEETEELEGVIEIYGDDIVADEEIILDGGVPLNDDVAALVAELELATQLPVEDENGNEPDHTELSSNSVPSTSSHKASSTSSNTKAPSTSSTISPIASNSSPPVKNRQTRKSPRAAKLLAKSKNVAKTKKQRKNIVKVKKNYKWSKKQFSKCVTIPKPNFTIPQSIPYPLIYLKKMFDDDLAKAIVGSTNLYSTQTKGESMNLSLPEFWDFISILLLMGIIKLPCYTDYWSREFNVPIISTKMSLKRFQAIRRYPHFNDNAEYDPTTVVDKYYKIRPFLEGLRGNFLKIEQETLSSVDEMMIPHKGYKAGSRKQYMPAKPKKWGFKFFVRSGVSGIVYDFLPYGGEATFFDHPFTEAEESLFGMSGKVVLTLCKSIATIPAAVYCDNFFSSLELFEYLRENHGVLVLGTIRPNRLRNLKMISDKELLKRGRGAFEQFCDNKNNLCVVKWADRKCVTLASSFVGTEPLTTIKRYSPEAKAKVNVSCPNVIAEYNSKMGGVDLNDMLIALYRTNYKPRKWYMPIFSQFLDIAVNNAWLLYRRELNLLRPTEKYEALKFFRAHLADNLYNLGRKGRKPAAGAMQIKLRKPIMATPNLELRHDDVGHRSIYDEKWHRCKLCIKNKSDVQCTKCKVFLCHTRKRNCFFNYHTF